MFTGIIEAVGRLQSVEKRQGDLRLTIDSGKLDLSDVQLGDSIATNGVCLTVVELTGSGYVADVSLETLEYTTLDELPVGSPLNLEKALTPTTRLGGHLVSGHVDGVGRVVSVESAARSWVYWLEAPKALARYIAHKGSITVDGVSLTVNRVDGCRFSLNIVPHTQQETVITHYRPGSRINLEVDVLARYLERLLDPSLKEENAEPASNLTEGFLAQHGFMR
ncbi:riboflavin synthase subunit alpha [Endozoicomonas montiporae]|uniref:Riboflavin synthase n=2 Tax=Endozoicomonas montiporae TaxID=1027273 RepID=A0A081N3I1_9GAMM|nr:riboflavin synthase [Endozoicomonas montiporae]AMO58312.1 riboflavin synthase subunit alpha [Endozoicomonas montiporae CL-33]KEQ13004.1 riboflavin synthase subunit alpha [Endozoicomonas montiporae]